LEPRFDDPIGAAPKVKSMDFKHSPLARAMKRVADSDKISLPREQLEDLMLAGLLLTVPCADVREVTIFGAAGLRSGATWIVAGFLPASSDHAGNLETVRSVEWELQSKYDMTIGS
jgi:hypothetical protein